MKIDKKRYNKMLTETGYSPMWKESVEPNNTLPIHFEFNQWEQMFEKIRSLWLAFIDVDLVISCHPYSSGYWIELPGGKLGEGDTKYDHDEIVQFEKTLRKEIVQAKKQNRSARFTLGEKKPDPSKYW